MQSSVEISKLVEDVSYIISSKLKDALTPVIELQSNTEAAILNLPFIQKIINENRSLKIKNAELETKLALVRENYKRLFLTKVSNEVNTSNVENNINLEIEEYNIARSDFDSISKIEQEIIELNKDNFDSSNESDLEQSISSSDTDNGDEELQNIIENDPEMCKRAIENYKIFYKMQTTPSIEDVFNSTAGINGWGSAMLSQKNNEKKEEEKKEEEKKEQQKTEKVVEEEQEKEEEEEDEEKQEEEEEEEDDDDDELEVEEVMIKGKMYYTDSHLNGDIYRVGDDGDIENIVGKFEKSQAIFF